MWHVLFVVVSWQCLLLNSKMTNVCGRNASSHSTPLLFIEKDLQSPSVPVPLSVLFYSLISQPSWLGYLYPKVISDQQIHGWGGHQLGSQIHTQEWRPCRRKENLKSRGSVHYSANILSSQLNTKHGFFLDCWTSLLKNMQMLFSNCRPIYNFF